MSLSELPPSNYLHFTLSEDIDRLNCTDIHHPPNKYNGSSCELVISECDGKYELINYLQFVVCDLSEQLQVQ